MYEFRGQEVRDVPQEVAAVCLDMRDSRGNPMFELTDSPDPDVENILGIQLEYRF
jgi:hypothetical protein